MARTALLVLAISAAADALRLQPRAVLTVPCPSRTRVCSIRLQESPSPSDELTPEQIVAAAEKAGEPVPPAQEAWPSQRPTPGVVPMAEDVADPDGKFDPRIILYVSLPALVLLGQLFFTFSRDALGDVALGPAIMD